MEWLFAVLIIAALGVFFLLSDRPAETVDEPTTDVQNHIGDSSS